MIDGPRTLEDMHVRHDELHRAGRDIENLGEAKQIGYVSKEVIHEMLFEERQQVYAAASRKVATTAEELAAQVDILVLEAADDPICIHADDDHHGQMMRSIRAGITGLSDSEPKEVNIEQFWEDYASLDDCDKRLIENTAKALRSQIPALKAAG